MKKMCADWNFVGLLQMAAQPWFHIPGHRAILVGLLLVTLVPVPSQWPWAGGLLSAAEVSIANNTLRLALDRSTGTLRALVQLQDQCNLLATSADQLALWKIQIVDGKESVALAADQCDPPTIEYEPNDSASVRLVWNFSAPATQRPMSVEVDIQLDKCGFPNSHWDLKICKPRDVRLKQIRFPRVPCLQPGTAQVLAAPIHMGLLTDTPQQLLHDSDGKGRRLAWAYPNSMSLQCVAYYETDGPGFYAAAEDTEAYVKTFAFWGDSKKRVHFEMTHDPEYQAVDTETFRLPYTSVLGTFRGDWSIAARRYRESPAAQAMADRGRLQRGLTPAWVQKTGLWAWNRGRSESVLVPAAELQEHCQVPVSVLWHWWHGCAYDVGFPDYLPPREGTDTFRSALNAAHEKGVHAIAYMSQCLWSTTTPSWKNEGAASYAAKRPDGSIRAHTFCTFVPAPCAVMCLSTDFWRNKYATLAEEVVCGLNADGIYMDMACLAPPCYDPNHGHTPGPGRYWTQSFGRLTKAIHDRCQDAPETVALAGEYCGEPWLPYLDLMLNLHVSEERFKTPASSSWQTIPFFQAVYHSSAISFGNYSSLVTPPFDEKWPSENAPPDPLRDSSKITSPRPLSPTGRGQGEGENNTEVVLEPPLSLLDRKFRKQFYLEQARTFVWGQQPMLANFFPSQLQERPEEIDYLTRMVRIRNQALKYLLHGTWLRPPKLNVSPVEIDLVTVGIYIGMSTTTASRPSVLAGAWRAADGDVALALAGIDDQQYLLQIPIDLKSYDLADRRFVYRIDVNGRQPIGRIDGANPILELEFPARGLWILEFCKE